MSTRPVIDRVQDTANWVAMARALESERKDALFIGVEAVTQTVGWVQLGLREPLFWRCFLVRLLVTTLPAWLCFRWQLGVLGLGTLALGAFPWPVRLTLDSRGIALSSFLVHARWGTVTLERVALEVDKRPHTWPRRDVIVIERRGRGSVRVFGSVAQLVDLERAAIQLGLAGRRC